jgi:hypothetical protein
VLGAKAWEAISDRCFVDVEVDHQDDLVDLTLQGSFITAEPFEAGVVPDKKQSQL